jgi:DNA-binding XRE family transcriptional regulator
MAMTADPRSCEPTTRLRRGRPRAFAEWHALRRWGKLPPWERRIPGYLLRLARLEAGLNQNELAGRLGITQQAISRTEQWLSNPTVAMLESWIEACGRTLVIEVGPGAARSTADQ